MKKIAICFLWAFLALTSRAAEFPVRGFHIDFRTQVMTLDAMKDFARELSEFGINKLIVEWEAAFPYDKHAVISNPQAFTPQEVTEFVSYCAGLGVDVIPLQQCFGHVEYILRHERYNALKETYELEISQVCPLKKGAVDLFTEIFAEVAALHPSEYFHIGADETFLLGKCKWCKEYVEKYGKSRLFVDYVVKMCEAVKALGKRPVLWADIITKYPEAIDRLPKDAILVDWNYGWNIKKFGDLDKILESGLEVWGAPAIRSHPDHYYSTDWKKHFNNQKDFIPFARESGYKGMVMTSWSTSGGYGFFWDQSHIVAEMDPIRQVFPMNAFRILIAMYSEALKSESPIDPHAFVTAYAQERFGLSADSAENFWTILNHPQTIIRKGKSDYGKGEDVSVVRDNAIADRDALYSMKVTKNKDEFALFLLMWDIRIQYLEYKVIENEINSPEFCRVKAGEMLKQLEDKVISKTRKLDKRFESLCSGYLKSDEIAYLNEVRVRQIEYIQAKLKNIASR